MTSRNQFDTISLFRNPFLVGGGLLALLVLAVAWDSKYIVQPGNIGIVTVLGEARDEPMREGFNLKFPFISSVHTLSVQPQAYNPSQRVAAGSSDLQQLNSEIQVEWKVDAAQGSSFYRQFRAPGSFPEPLSGQHYRRSLQHGHRPIHS